MIDLTFNKKDKSEYILKYNLSGDFITVFYADGNNIDVPYSDNKVLEIEELMKKQVTDSNVIENIDNKLRINNFMIAGSAGLAMLSCLALCGFALTKSNGAIVPVVTMTTGFACDGVFIRRKNKLLELRNYAEKYKLLANNLDHFNYHFSGNNGTRDMTMNDADSFDLVSLKTLLKMVKKD